MADDKIDNEQELEEAKPLSFFDEKMKGLLDELDERLEQIGGDFGPILMEELQNRLENIVRNFNEEVNTLFTESFKKWKVKDMQLREMMSHGIIKKKTENKQDNESTQSPNFIKDVKFGSKHIK